MTACIVAPFVRPAEPDDLPGLLAIYNHYVAHTAITFDIEPVTLLHGAVVSRYERPRRSVDAASADRVPTEA